MVKDRPTLFVGGLFFLLGLIFCGIGAWLFFGDRLESLRLQSEGAAARAEVLRKQIVANRTQGSFVRPKHRIEYRFAPARGEPVEGEADIDPALWQRVGKGDAIEVAYLPADPAIHSIEGEATDWVVALVFALIGGFFAPVGLWLALGRAGDAQAAGATRWINDNPPLALGSIGVVFFLPFAAAGAGWFMAASDESAEFASRGQAVEGIVIAKSIVRKSSGTSGGSRSTYSTHYRVVYRYAAEGVEVLGSADIDSDAWDRLKERGPIAVTYVGSTPWKHRLPGEGGFWIAPAVFLAIGAVGMAGSGYAALRGWQRRGAAAAPRRAKAKKTSAAPAAQAPARSAPKSARGGNWIMAGAGTIFFVAGSTLAVSGAVDLVEERRFDAEGEVAEARIVDKGIDEARRSEQRGTAYNVTYRFATREGKIGEGRAVLKPDAWEKAKPGDILRVRYLPERPRSSRLHGESRWTEIVVAVLVGPVFALIGAALLLGAWFAWREGDR